MHKPVNPRPDLLDTLVTCWLSAAVCAASLVTAPFDAYRAPWVPPAAEPDLDEAPTSGELDAWAGQASTVSNVRPDDVGASVVAEPGTTETCRDCRFYRDITSMAGECRRFAPEMGESPRAEWPITEAKAWCGMHVPALIPVH